MSVEANKANVLRYLKAVERFDMAEAATCFAEDAVQHYPAPGKRRPTERDAIEWPGEIVGRDAIVGGFAKKIPELYHVDTVTLHLQNLIGEGDFVAARWVLTAKSKLRGEHYANHYHFLFRCRNGLIAEYWEYCDTAYGLSLLY
jgi:ketosteroid isomerase-like protein